MKVPFSWLKDYVDINVTPEVLADKMVKAGFEVEEIIDLSQSIKKVVIGKIFSIERHPDAEKLVICQLDCGPVYGQKQIVTAATNVRVGDIVPVCMHGAVLPDGKTITKGKLRGVLSEGMMCGGSELDLTADDYTLAGVDGIFILDDHCPLGTDINVYLQNDDYILDIGVTANRPDCNSIIGIAREVSAVLNVPFKGIPHCDYTESGDVSDYVKVTVKADDLCPRYMAKAVKNIKIEQSPEIIRRRLRKVGIRPINNIVDITNYVLTEIGQPMHSFDANKIGGKEIIVRRAEENEKIVTLDEKENVLNGDNLVICDADKPVALAGIMGGMNSGISDDTTDVVFESACFKRDNVRRTSRKLGLRSDSSARFEKGIDFLSQELAIERVCSMIAELGCGEIVGGVIDTLGKTEDRKISVSVKRINAILGIDISSDIMVDILSRLSLSPVIDGDIISLIIPGYREDLINANDIAEEVIRFYGYDNIVSAPLDGLSQTQGVNTYAHETETKIRNLLSGTAGYNECVSYSFISPSFVKKLRIPEGDYRTRTIELLNPLGEELSVMRTTLLHSMLNLIAGNIARGNKSAKLYEIGKVYLPHELPLSELPDEKPVLMLAEFGPDKTFYTIKSALQSVLDKLNITAEFAPEVYPWLHPGRSAVVTVNGETLGYIGEIHPDVQRDYKIEKCYVAELWLDVLIENEKSHLPFVDLPKFPAISRDLAFVVDNSVNAKSLIDEVNRLGGRKLLESVKVFDVYSGKGIPSGKKSVALALSFRAKDRTLVDTDVNPLIDKIIKGVEISLGAVLR